MYSDNKEHVTGEWQTDEYGHRFRRVGNIIEHEPEIGGMPQSVFFRSMKAQKIADEENRKRELAEQQARKTDRVCPWKAGHNQITPDCEKDCPFYHEDRCVFAITDKEPQIDTKGKYCPIAGRCNERCAMYAKGCKLIELVKCMKHGKE